jgi:hypothetical protein
MAAVLSSEEYYSTAISALSSFCPAYVQSDKLFIYAYILKGALHIRVDYDLHFVKPDFWRRTKRRIFSPAECRELGISENTLLAYYNLMCSYTGALAGMNQNKQIAHSDPLVPADIINQINSLNKHRYTAAKNARHRCASYLAAMRKRLRVILVV